jgi:5-methylcytosine-specific restriction protein A
MPQQPKRYCTQPGCSVLVEAGQGGRCGGHARQPFRSASHTVERIRGTHLQRLRKELFDRQPLCVLCEKAGRVTIATIRDHIVALSDGGTEDAANTQALCHACNEDKRRHEIARGMAKWK